MRETRGPRRTPRVALGPRVVSFEPETSTGGPLVAKHWEILGKRDTPGDVLPGCSVNPSVVNLRNFSLNSPSETLFELTRESRARLFHLRQRSRTRISSVCCDVTGWRAVSPLKFRIPLGVRVKHPSNPKSLAPVNTTPLEAGPLSAQGGTKWRNIGGFARNVIVGDHSNRSSEHSTLQEVAPI